MENGALELVIGTYGRALTVGGLIAVDGQTGEIVMDWNSLGMMRGWCTVTIDSDTSHDIEKASMKAPTIDRRGEVALWEDLVKLFQ